jgi:hypothetical protein
MYILNAAFKYCIIRWHSGVQVMANTIYEGHVENGQIKLDGGVSLPENTKVIVMIPSVEGERVARIMSPRLVKEPGARPRRFEVSWEPSGDSKV